MFGIWKSGKGLFGKNNLDALKKDILLFKQITATNQIANKGADGSNPFISARDLISGDNGIVTNGKIQLIQDYDYKITESVYVIKNKSYSSPITSFTLDASHATLNRTDVIVGTFDNDGNGLIKVIKGAESANPIKPSINPDIEIELGRVDVLANTTTQDSVVSFTIYDEDETIVDNDGGNTSVVGDNTDSPYKGTKCIQVDNFTSGQKFYIDLGTTINVSAYTNLILNIISTSGKWGKSGTIKLALVNSDKDIVSNIIPIYSLLGNTTYCFDSTLDEWQSLLIPISGLTLVGDATGIIIFKDDYRGTDSFKLDYIHLQGGIELSSPLVSGVDKTSDIKTNDGATGVSPYAEIQDLAIIQGANLIIGGIGATINTKALLAEKFSFTENDVANMVVIDNDVYAVIDVNYLVLASAFEDNVNITSFKDLGGLWSGTSNESFQFKNCINLEEVILKGVITFANSRETFRGCLKLGGDKFKADFVTNFGTYTFRECKNGSDWVFNGIVTITKSRTFWDLIGGSVSMPNCENVTSNVFENYYGTINLPKCINVGDTAFHNSDSRTYININFQTSEQSGITSAIARGSIVEFLGKPIMLPIANENDITQFEVDLSKEKLQFNENDFSFDPLNKELNLNSNVLKQNDLKLINASNLVIGGVALEITNKTELALALRNYPTQTAFSETNISQFNIINDDIYAIIDIDFAIPTKAFKDSTTITFLKDDKNLKNIGYNSFTNSTIKTFEAYGLNGISQGISGNFQGCLKLTSFIAPTINTITKSDFYGCTNLSIVDIPLVTNINNTAFGNCTSLKSINAENLRHIETGSFSGCSKLEYINLSQVTTLLGSSFISCSSLKSINNANKLLAIEPKTFEECSSLYEFEANNVLTINYGAFSNCTSLVKVEMLSLQEIIQAGGITRTFKGCSSLELLNIPNCVLIGDNSVNNAIFSGLPNNCIINVNYSLHPNILGYTEIDLEYTINTFNSIVNYIDLKHLTQNLTSIGQYIDDVTASTNNVQIGWLYFNTTLNALTIRQV